MRSGLSLVEQEMPASISFHVPDQYHKRIIGIGGQHIQRIMKKHSVFVKFSNAMDRGGAGREDDDIKVDNVICRTPARNAGALELVKAEILDMVDRVVRSLPALIQCITNKSSGLGVYLTNCGCQQIVPSATHCTSEPTGRARKEVELQDHIPKHRTSQ